MSNPFSLEQAIALVTKQAEERLKKQTKEVILAYEAAAKLQAAGFEVKLTESNYDSISVRIRPNPRKNGEQEYFFGHGKRDQKHLTRQLNAVRKALGCSLKMSGKSVANTKRRIIGISLTPEKYPMVYVGYYKRLGKDAKCSLKTTSYRSASLVCPIG